MLKKTNNLVYSRPNVLISKETNDTLVINTNTISQMGCEMFSLPLKIENKLKKYSISLPFEMGNRPEWILIYIQTY